LHHSPEWCDAVDIDRHYVSTHIGIPQQSTGNNKHWQAVARSSGKKQQQEAAARSSGK